MSEVFETSSHPYFITRNLIYMFFCDVSLTELGIELTVAGQNDYCDTITIAESTIAILLLLPKALLRYYYYCRKHYCDTITIAESTIAILLLLPKAVLQYYYYCGFGCNTIAIITGNIIYRRPKISIKL